MVVTVAPSSLSDSALDSAYSLAVTEKRFADANVYAAEIVNRLASPVGYALSLFGSTRFPLYEGMVGFSASEAAQSSTIASAGKLVDKAGAAASGVLSFGKNTLIAVAVVIVGLAVLYIFVRYGGKK